MVDLAFLHNAVDEGDFTEDVCRGLLDVLAEVEYLRAELKASLEREKQLSKLLSEYESRDLVKIATEMEIALGDMQARISILEIALPDPELLERAAEYANSTVCKGCPLRAVPCGRDCSLVGAPLRAAAALIQEARA